MKRKPKQKRSIILKILLLAFCVYMLCSLGVLISKYNKDLAVLEEEKERYANDLKAIEELEVLLNSDSDDLLIEKAARERLGYAYSDEQVFIDISGN